MRHDQTMTLRKLLLTGAAGNLGRVLAPDLASLCDELVLSDLPASLDKHGIQGVGCDLADADAVEALMQGVEAVVHLGGVSVEGPFEPILQANLRGVHNLYESARRQGTRRIVFASSNHVIGCARQGQKLKPDCEPQPDGNYGVSKLFGEGMARLYWDRYGIESVCLRIGTALPEPIDRRSLSTWLSPRDLFGLIRASLTAPNVGFTLAYGNSANPRAWWDSSEAWARLGFVPQDSAEPWAAQLESIHPPEDSLAAQMQGGGFLNMGPYDR